MIEDGFVYAPHPGRIVFGAGVARELMREAKGLSPGFLQLDVNADNHRAVAFYEREGFRPFYALLWQELPAR